MEHNSTLQSSRASLASAGRHDRTVGEILNMALCPSAWPQRSTIPGSRRRRSSEIGAWRRIA